MADNKQVTKEKTSEKPKVVRKPKGIAKWWRETMGELRKVVWPTPRAAMQMTKVVLLVMAGLSVIFGLFDYAFSKLLGWILA